MNPQAETKKRHVSRGSKPTSGHSLLELVVVLGLLTILVYLTTSRFSRSVQEKQLTACQRNLQTIGVALNLYLADNRGAMPFVANAESSEAPLSLLVPRCTTVTEIFICPGSKDARLPEGERFAKSRISYAYFMGRGTNIATSDVILSDRQVDTAPKKQGGQVFSADGKPPGDNHTTFGGNFLFSDGHAEHSPPRAAHDWTGPTNSVLLNPRPKP